VCRDPAGFYKEAYSLWLGKPYVLSQLVEFIDSTLVFFAALPLALSYLLLFEPYYELTRFRFLNLNWNPVECGLSLPTRAFPTLEIT